MNIIDRTTILAFHKARVRDFGTGTELALGWKTTASQTLRFDVLADIACLNDRSVLDIGCGHGDLRAHLAAQYPRIHYMGIDHLKDFLDVAVTRFGNWPNTTFYLGDFSCGELPEADYVLASGAMGYRCSDPLFVFRMITRLFAACRLGFGFNMLSRVDNPKGILTAYDPKEIVAHCHALTSKVILHEEYLDDDFTVMMYH